MFNKKAASQILVTTFHPELLDIASKIFCVEQQAAGITEFSAEDAKELIGSSSTNANNDMNAQDQDKDEDNESEIVDDDAMEED